MARKRRKSRAKKKRPEAKPAEAAEAPEEDASATVSPGEAKASDDPSAPDDPSGPDGDTTTGDDPATSDDPARPDELIDLDGDLDGESIDDLLTDEPQWLDVPDEPIPLVSSTLTDPDEEVVEISLDDDDDDAARLIAETLAFVGETVDGDEVPTEDGGSTDAGNEEESASDVEGRTRTEAEHDDAARLGGDSTEADEVLLSGEYTLPPTTTEAPPRLTVDALQALRGIQTEGIASLPPEVLLDLGDPDGPADRDRILQAALAHAEMQDAIYRVPGADSQPRSAKPFIVGAILLMAALLAIAPPGFLTPPPPPAVTAGDRLLGHRITLLLQAQQVEAFRSTAGRLPSSLAELDRPLPGIQYVQSNNRVFQLVLRTGDRTLIYDSAAPDPSFQTLADRWVTTREDG